MKDFSKEFGGLFGNMMEQMKSWKAAFPTEPIEQYSGFCSAFRTAFLKTSLTSDNSFYENKFDLDELEFVEFNAKYTSALKLIKYKLLMESNDLWVYYNEDTVVVLSQRYHMGSIFTTNKSNIESVKKTLGIKI